MEARGYPVSLLVKHETEVRIDRYMSSNTPLVSAIFTEMDTKVFPGAEYWYEICGSTKPCELRQGWNEKVADLLDSFSPVWLRFRTSEIFAIADDSVVKARRFLYCYAKKCEKRSFQGIFSHFYHPEIFHPILEEQRDDFWEHARKLVNVMTYRQFLGLCERGKKYDLGLWGTGDRKRIIDELVEGRSIILLDESNVLRACAFAIELSQFVSDDVLEAFRDIPIVVSSGDFKDVRRLFIGVGGKKPRGLRSDLLVVNHSKKELEYWNPSASGQKKQSDVPKNPPAVVVDVPKSEPGPAASVLPGLLCTFFVQFPRLGLHKNAWKSAEIFCSRDDVRKKVKAFFEEHSAEFYGKFEKNKTGRGVYRYDQNSSFLFSGIGSYVFGCLVDDTFASHFNEIKGRLESQKNKERLYKKVLEVYAAECGA